MDNKEQKEQLHTPPDQEQVTLGPAAQPRRLQAGILIIVLLALVLVIVGSTTHLLDPVVQRFIGPSATPLPTLAPGDDRFYVNMTPWGSVFVDGKVIKDVSKPIILSRGLHQFVWHAEPFNPIACTVSVPYLFSKEPCTREDQQSTSGSPARIITFTPNLADLPDNQRTALLQQTQAALDAIQSNDIVQPGEQYGYQSASQSVPSAVTANQSLRATLRFHLDADPHSNRTCSQYGDNCTINNQNCHTFCTLNYSYNGAPGEPIPTPTPPSSSTEIWNAVAVEYATWEYKTMSGQVVAQDQPDASSASVDPDHSVGLNIQWNGQSWKVKVTFGGGQAADPGCSTMTETVDGYAMNVASGSANLPILDWAGYTNGANRAQGCVGIAVAHQDNGTPTVAAVSKGVYFLYRFGVLLAANALAHKYMPALPVADSYEQGIAQRIANAFKP